MFSWEIETIVWSTFNTVEKKCLRFLWNDITSKVFMYQSRTKLSQGVSEISESLLDKQIRGGNFVFLIGSLHKPTP